jgi:toxin CcdB
MAQFDVHRNPGRTRTGLPYLVVVQSLRFADHPRRLVAPLGLVGGRPRLETIDHSPVFLVEGRQVALDPLQLQAVPREALGPAIASLAQDSDRIIKAIDAVITRAWG